MKSKITYYLSFLTGEDFTINDTNVSEPQTDLSKKSCATLHYLQQNNVLEYIVQYNAEGNTVTTLTKINLELLERQFQIKFNTGLYYFAQLFNTTLKAIKTTEGITLQIPETQKNAHALVALLDPATKSRDDAEDSAIKALKNANNIDLIIKWFDLIEVQKITEIYLKMRIDFFSKILGISFEQPEIPNLSPSDIILENATAKLSSFELDSSSSYTKWLLQELEWLQKHEICSFEKELRGLKIVIHIQNINDAIMSNGKQLNHYEMSHGNEHYQKISIFNYHSECYYRDTLSLKNCLGFMLGIDSWIPSISGNFISDIIDHTNPFKAYATEKLKELQKCAEYEIISESDDKIRIRIKIIDRKEFLLLVLKKLFMGIEYCSKIFGQDILARFCVDSFTIFNTNIFYPHLYLTTSQADYLNENCPIRILKSTRKNHPTAIAIWFDEKFLYKKALAASCKTKALLDKVFAVSFEINLASPEVYENREAESVAGCLQEGITYSFNDKAHTYGIVYKTAKLDKQSANQTLKTITELSKAEIIKWYNEPSKYWGLSEKPAVLDCFEIQIMDEEKLKKVAAQLEAKPVQNTNKTKDDCLLM